MQIILFVALCIVGTAVGNIAVENSLNNEIPGLSSLPFVGITEETGKKFLKEKCKNQTSDDKIIDKISEARHKFQDCFTNQLNISGIQQEIEAAKPTGDLDVVFGKYCRKIPTLMQCTKDLYKVLEPCLTVKEKDGAKIMYNATQSIIDFLCYKDGDRIALFIAEGGVECVKSKQSEVQNCWQQNAGENLPTEIPQFESLCSTLGTLQTCVVSELEKCKEPTPANLIEALFKYVRKIVTCPKKQ